MSAALDHLIVFARDREASAAYLAEVLGAPAPSRAGHFTQVQVDHGLTVDFMNTDGRIATQHYAFLVSEAQFDASFAKIRDRQQPYWADPYRRRPHEVNALDGGGKLVYFEDPSGHFLEIRTRPSRVD
jgi:catechol 2,3-dioxygenase-like lactoylglutathione lyase family enzyme